MPLQTLKFRLFTLEEFNLVNYEYKICYITNIDNYGGILDIISNNNVNYVINK